jgi:hypothetical protein
MLLVRDVSGPALALAGEKARFRATSFNMSSPPEEELNKINWRITSGGDTIDEFLEAGPILSYKVPLRLSGRDILVMPYRNSPTETVSVLTHITEEDTAHEKDNIIFLSREEWGADSDLPRRGHIVDPRARTEIFIHHTVIVDNDATQNEWESLEEVKKNMRRLQTIRPDLGKDVPYSIVAFCMADGGLVLGEGRGIHRSGAHTLGHNTSALGISFQGNFEKLPMPPHIESQLAMLGNWLQELREHQGFMNLGNERPLGREVFAHRDIKATACPGEHLFNKLNRIRFL